MEEPVASSNRLFFRIERKNKHGILRTEVLTTPFVLRSSSCACLKRAAHTHLRVSEHFERAVRVWEAVLLLQPMEVWLPLCEGLEKGLTPLGQALGLLMEHAAVSYEDLLGRVYMELSQQDKGLGQYFTPFPVAQMMASLKCQNVVLPESDAPPLRCLEPSCGSGVMLLAIACIVFQL